MYIEVYQFLYTKCVIYIYIFFLAFIQEKHGISPIP